MVHGRNIHFFPHSSLKHILIWNTVIKEQFKLYYFHWKCNPIIKNWSHLSKGMKMYYEMLCCREASMIRIMKNCVAIFLIIDLCIRVLVFSRLMEINTHPFLALYFPFTGLISCKIPHCNFILQLKFLYPVHFNFK